MPYASIKDRRRNQAKWREENRDRVNAYNRARYAADPSCQRRATTNWRKNNREQYNRRQRNWVKANRSRLYNPSTEDGLARLDKENARKRQSHLLLKAEVLTHYGGGVLRCTADGCAVADLDMLTIDHIENDGASHRKEMRDTGQRMIYRFLKRNNWPKGFQTLCANHQMKKELERLRGECKSKRTLLQQI